MKCYMVRIQHAGWVTTHVFQNEPTPEQMAPLIVEAERIHGRSGLAWVESAQWVTGSAIPVVAPPPQPAPPAKAGAGAADVGKFIISGTGTVTPKK